MRKESLDWLKREYGVDPKTLAPDERRAAKKLGPDGVNQLIEARTIESNATNRAKNLARLQEIGMSPRWVGPGARKVKGDKPRDWVEDKASELGEDLFPGGDD
jgi:hypothetical protein